MICFISSKYGILVGNRVRGARKAHRDFPRVLPEADSEASKNTIFILFILN
jgi:hypothetical protein